MNAKIITWIWFFAAVHASGANPPDPLRFEPNLGQVYGSVQYLGRSRGALVLVQNAVVSFRNPSLDPEETLKLSFDGANSFSRWQEFEKSGEISYFVGTNRSKWIRSVPQFAKLSRKNVYDGIDLVLYGSNSHFEYDFIVSPGADVDSIRLRFAGGRLALQPNGDLVVRMRSGKFTERRPEVYQVGADGARRRIDAGYRVLGRNTVGFRIGNYDRGRPLIIDPVIESATLLGGTGDDRVIFADPRFAIVGTTSSIDFPGVETSRHRGRDIFIYDPVRQATTIIGGSRDDIVTCAKLSGSPSPGVYIGGYTNSRDFPVVGWQDVYSGLPSAPQGQYGGGDWDGFVLFLYPSSYPTPFFSTYLGGSGDDRVLGIDGLAFGSIATTGTTTSVDFPLAHAIQDSPGGGMDGFAAFINYRGVLSFSSYLGGSGDDRGLAVVISASGKDLYFGGETRSDDWQWPGGWSGSRSGPSDAFLLHLITVPFTTTMTAAAGAQFGGSGEDRITALTLPPNGSVAVAGVTNSRDLPGSTPYAGGTSDAFVASFASLAGAAAFVETFGGSGSEEPTVLGTNGFNELLVGGWTNSADFPVFSSSVDGCGKGSDDGFLVHLDSIGRTLLATCFGGSGADRVTSIISDGGQRIFFGGYTDSADLPLKDALQSTNAGAVDGFYGTLIEQIIHADQMTIGKDLTGNGYAVLGDSANHVGITLTATSSDPAKVRLSVLPGEPGLVSVSVANAAGSLSGDRAFLVHCLTDSATVAVTLAANGYPDRDVNVGCVLSGLNVSVSDGGNSILVTTAAFDPVSRKLIAAQTVRPGLDPVRVDVVNPSPDVVEFQRTSVTFDSFSTLSSGTFFFTARATSDVSFSTTSGFAFIPSNTVRIRSAASVMNLYVPAAARDLMVPIGFSLSAASAANPVPVTLTSSNPSKILIATDPTKHGEASVTVNFKASNGAALAWLEILDASPGTTITATAPGSAAVTVEVPSGELVAEFYRPNGARLPDAELLPGQTLDAAVRTYVNPLPAPGVFTVYPFRPGTRGYELSVTSSAPAIASGGLSITGFSTGLWPFAIKAITRGNTVFTAKFGSGVFRVVGPLTVTVPPISLTLDSATLGANLMTPVNVRLTGATNPGTVTITASSSDPSRVLVSADPLSAGTASVKLSLQYQSVPLYVHALTDSGTVEITAGADSAGSLAFGKATISLVPSGFAWASPAVSLSGATVDASIAAYALDPATNAAFAKQLPRPGLTGSFGLTSSNPGVASVDPSVSLSAFGAVPFVTSKITQTGEGTAEISITQPPGFVSPAGRGALRVKSSRIVLAFPPMTVGRNLQVPASIRPNYPESAPAVLTLRSTDPTRLLLATNSAVAGSASVSVKLADGGYNVFLQGLDGPADVPVVASAPGLQDVPSVVRVINTALYFGTQSSYPADLAIHGSTQDDAITLSVSVAPPGTVYSSAVLRPGLDPIAIVISSSNPNIVAVDGQPVLNSLTNQTTVRVRPIGHGKTDLTLTVPPGFVPAVPLAGRTAHITVDGPSIILGDLRIGKDLQLQGFLSVANGSQKLSIDVDVTITSSDPANLLLSADAAAPGTGSLAMHFTKGSTLSRGIYLQALGGSGEVQVGISAAGYLSSANRITLAGTKFAADTGSIAASVPDGPVTIRIRPVPAVAEGSFYGSPYSFRPGFAGFSTSLSSSNASIATVSPSSLLWTAGSAEQTIKVQPVSSGSGTIQLDAPAPFTQLSLPVQIRGGTFFLSPFALTVGKELQDAISISGSSSFSGAVTVTVSSADPSRVLVSSSPALAGQGRVDLQSQPGKPLFVYVQALSDTGTVSLTFSAPGYTATPITVQLSPAIVTLTSTPPGTLTPLSAPVKFEVRLTSPNSGSFGTATLRPGAGPVTVQITLSDSTVGSVSPTQVTFSPGDVARPFTFQPNNPGFTLLSASVPAGFGDAPSLRQQLLTVVAARAAFLNPAAVGKDLVRSNAIRLPSAASRDLTLTLTSADPSKLLLGTFVNSSGAASVQLTIPSGATISPPFYLLALASSGSVSLNVSGVSLSLADPDVSLQPSGFQFFQIANTVRLSDSLSLVVRAVALNALTFASEDTFPLRTGVAPVVIAVTSSNPQVFGSFSISLFGGDSQGVTNVRPVSTGSATLTVQTPQGFARPSVGAAATVTVQ